MESKIISPESTTSPSIFNWTLGFVLVGIAWGFTTPFIRKAAVDFNPPVRPALSNPNSSWLGKKILTAYFSILDLLSKPGYAVPLLLNLTGSVWFFLLIGQAELSLTVPITNSLAFLFTVLGEWCAEGKIITKETWIGMAFVLLGIGLCAQSKTTTG